MQLYENMGCIHLGSTGIGWEKCWERLEEFFPDSICKVQLQEADRLTLLGRMFPKAGLETQTVQTLDSGWTTCTEIQKPQMHYLMHPEKSLHVFDRLATLLYKIDLIQLSCQQSMIFLLSDNLGPSSQLTELPKDT